MTAQANPQLGPKLKTFEDGVMEAYKILDLFRRHPHAHWVRVTEASSGRVLTPSCPDLCDLGGKPCKNNMQSCPGLIEEVVVEGVVTHILCKRPYPAKEPLFKFGLRVQEERPSPLTSSI